jgi:FkbM family methyltransferase
MTNSLEHHAVFLDAELWHGRVADHVDVDFLGACEDRQFFLPEWADRPRDMSRSHDQWAVLPAVDEEYFEWIDALAAARTAERRFVMMELGAGYGRWLMRGAAAIKRFNPLPTLLIGVEAEPTHVEWMRLNFLNNGLDPGEHRIIHAAVAATSGSTWFPVGDAREWGQFMAPDGRSGARQHPYMGHIEKNRFLDAMLEVSCTTIASAATGADVVDLIDMDIQGAEAEVMEEAITFCSERVRLIHVGTHGPDIERRLADTFIRAGWISRFNFASSSITETPFGRISFIDGVQSWSNPRFASRLSRFD